MTDDESLNARRLDSGVRPGRNRDPLIQVDEKGAGAVMPRTSTSTGYGLLFLLPIESYESSYSAPLGTEGARSVAGGALPL